MTPRSPGTTRGTAAVNGRTEAARAIVATAAKAAARRETVPTGIKTRLPILRLRRIQGGMPPGIPVRIPGGTAPPASSINSGRLPKRPSRETAKPSPEAADSLQENKDSRQTGSPNGAKRPRLPADNALRPTQKRVPPPDGIPRLLRTLTIKRRGQLSKPTPRTRRSEKARTGNPAATPKGRQKRRPGVRLAALRLLFPRLRRAKTNSPVSMLRRIGQTKHPQQAVPMSLPTQAHECL